MKTSIKIFVLGALLVLSNSLHAQPDKWFLAGSSPESYEFGAAVKQYNSKDVIYLNSTKKNIDGFGTVMKGIYPGEYSGKRVRLTGYIKAENVVDWAGMWMRVDGTKPNEMLAFDNMEKRPIKGSTDWEKYEIVLDVGSSGTVIAYGVLLNGTGNILLSDLVLEIVANDTPTTNIK